FVQRVVARAVAEQAAHADLVRVVVLDPVLASQRVAHRRLHRVGQGDDLVVRVAHPGAAEQRDGVRGVDGVGELSDLGGGRHHLAAGTAVSRPELPQERLQERTRGRALGGTRFGGGTCGGNGAPTTGSAARTAGGTDAGTAGGTAGVAGTVGERDPRRRPGPRGQPAGAAAVL